jgi:DNA polymerase I-like protein with 3'-5' exonuclease and polymerase domains
MQLIDVEGLTLHGDQELAVRLARAAYPEAYPIKDRLKTLAMLREGAGVQVITGAVGKEWWSVAGVEVQVTVWPDGYDWTERADSLDIWALMAAGLGATDAVGLYRSHLRHGKKPTQRHRLAGAVEEAESWKVRLIEECREATPLVYEEVDFDVVDIEAGVQELYRLVRSKDRAAIDFEWHRETQELVGLAVSTSNRNLYVPVWASDVDNREHGSRIGHATKFAIRGGMRGVGHGLRADLGTQIPGDPIDLLDNGAYSMDDTMVIAYLLGETRLGLKPLSRKYLDRDPIENDREWAEMPARFTARYAAAGDTRNTYDLFTVLDKRLTGRQREVYEHLERPLVPVIASMEKFGTPVDMVAVLKSYREHVAVEYGLRRAIQEHYDRDVATDAEARRFMVDCGLSDPGTVDQRTISLYDHWCIDLLLEYRQTRTRRRNFLKGIIKRWNEGGRPDDFRVYPRFNQAGRADDDDITAPKTGRLSSSGPNLQNQPSAIREIYVPPPGCKWWSFDYSQLEIRIAAALSLDPELLKVVLGGENMHDKTQAYVRDVYGLNLSRKAAKIANFLLQYEGGAGNLMRGCAKEREFITFSESQSLVDAHHNLYKVYHQWGAEKVREARYRGYAETWFGRQRWVEEYTSTDPEVQKHGDRSVQNHGVQGTAADVVKRAMLNVVPVLKKYGGHMCIQVHDELDGWVPEDVDLVAFEQEMRDAMETEINGVRLTVDGGVGRNWAETH